MKVLEIKSVLSLYASIVFTFWFLVMEKMEDKVLACFYANPYLL
jgi:hypothetical protein